MKSRLTKEEVLSSLGIQSFENVTTDMVVEFIKQARKMTPEDQDEALRQLFDFGKLAHAGLEKYLELGKEAFKGNDENMKRVNDQYASMQRFLEDCAKGTEDFEKKKYIYEEMKELADRVERKDSENKNFSIKLMAGAAACVVGVAVGVWIVKGK